MDGKDRRRVGLALVVAQRPLAPTGTLGEVTGSGGEAGNKSCHRVVVLSGRLHGVELMVPHSEVHEWKRGDNLVREADEG
jgi:hypothetical protein